MSDFTENTWTVHYDEDGDFPKFFNSLKEHERAAVILTIENILTPLGINICQTEWGKALGQGLYEIRIRHTVKKSQEPRQKFRLRTNPQRWRKLTGVASGILYFSWKEDCLATRRI